MSLNEGLEEMSQVQHPLGAQESYEPTPPLSDDVEEDEATRVRTRASLVTPWLAGYKVPVSYTQADLWREEEEEPEEPDLEEYFTRCGTDWCDRIKLCRTYANYLAAAHQPKRGPAKRMKKE